MGAASLEPSFRDLVRAVVFGEQHNAGRLHAGAGGENYLPVGAGNMGGGRATPFSFKNRIFPDQALITPRRHQQEEAERSPRPASPAARPCSCV